MKKLISVCLLITFPAFSKPILFKNAKIFIDFTTHKESASEILVSGGKIIEVGKNIKAPTGSKTVDLKGQYVMPSLTDAHAHIVSLGKEKFEIELKGSKTPEEAASRVKKFIADQKILGETAVIGRGWDQTDWPQKQFPSRLILDSLSSTQPILLYRVDGHAAWVNTQALKLSGVWEQKLDPTGGKILRDDKSIPTGILIDDAMEPLQALKLKKTPAEIQRNIQMAVDQALSLGITSIHDAGIENEELEVLRKMIRNKDLGFRFYEMLSANDEKALAKALKNGPMIGVEGGRLTVRAVKVFMDGAMGSRGASFDEPYDDEPNNSGLLMYSPEEFQNKVRQIDRAGFQVAVHAIGSKGNRIAIDAFEKILGDKVAIKRPRLEHAQVLTEKEIQRMAQLGVIASMQPTHCTSDMKWVVDRIGKERAKYAYAWRSILKAKVPLAFGSDAPVEDINPWPGLFAAITRQNMELQPEAGFFPEQRLNLQEALEAFTAGAAFAGFQENELGTLSKGKWADFIVLENNPFELLPKQIYDLKVKATYVGGIKRYEAERGP